MSLIYDTLYKSTLTNLKNSYSNPSSCDQANSFIATVNTAIITAGTPTTEAYQAIYDARMWMLEYLTTWITQAGCNAASVPAANLPATTDISSDTNPTGTTTDTTTPTTGGNKTLLWLGVGAGLLWFAHKRKLLKF